MMKVCGIIIKVLNFYIYERTNEMICCENKGERMPITKYERLVCGLRTEYCLTKNSEGAYEVTVNRNGESATALFCGEFFEIVNLFKNIINTDTLPDNICDIAEDFNDSETIKSKKL